MNLVVLLATTILVLWTASLTHDAMLARREAVKSFVDAELLLSDLRDAETGQRGYLLTGVDRYLAPFERAASTIEGRLTTLRLAVEDAPLRPGQLDELGAVTRAKMQELRETVELRRTRGFEAAKAIVLTDNGEGLMDRARALIGEIETVQRLFIEQRSEQLERLQRLLAIGVVLASVFEAAFLVLTNIWIVRAIARPLAALRAGIERISGGNTDGDIWVRGSDEFNDLARAFNAMSAAVRAESLSRTKAEAEAVAIGAALRARGEELEKRTRIIDLLGQMANRLPGCVDEEEFAQVIERYAPQILPGVPGALHVLTHSQRLMRRVCEWNSPTDSTTDFTPTECWGLRRGQPHVVDNVADDILCAHIHPRPDTRYRCLPLVAQGETVGMLYIEEPSSIPALNPQDLEVLTETVSFSLVNLRLREKLRNQSIRDPLTGLFNRRYLEETLDIECARAERSSQALSVVMIDVDHFKRFNDEHGHDAGDLVLKNVADVLRASLRQGDVACRYGGEEFLLVLPGASIEDAAIVAERVRQGARALDAVHRGQSLGRITVSLGVAPYRQDGGSSADLIDAADQALYKAKQAGRDRVMRAPPLAVASAEELRLAG